MTLHSEDVVHEIMIRRSADPPLELPPPPETWIIIDDPVGPITLDSAPVPQGFGITVTSYLALSGKYLAKIVRENSNPAQTYFLHADVVGSIRAITDSAGQVVARFDYEPFGLLAMSTGPMASGAHRFTGKPEDEATGLYYFGARYYDPEVGRFAGRDPICYGLNWYDYCCQNPPVYVDPDGKHPWDAKRLLNQYRSDIVRISETYGIPPAALATVVYCENVRRSYISELKDEAAILGLIMEGHDASIGICQVKFSTALMLDFGYPPKRLAEDPVTCMDYAARYLAFLAEAREYKSPELWLSDYNRGLSEYTDPTAYGEQYRKVARRYGFRAE